jgi:hypothetical protein
MGSMNLCTLMEFGWIIPGLVDKMGRRERLLCGFGAG